MKLFHSSYGSTLSLFHFKKTKTFISDTSARHTRIFFLSFVLYTLLSWNSLQDNMILQGRVWIIIQIIHFLIDVLSSVDGFNLSSLNFSLSVLSMYDDSIFVAILHIQKLYISPSLDCSAVSYSIWGPTYVCKESAMVLFGIAPLWPQLIVIRHGVPIFMT